MAHLCDTVHVFDFSACLHVALLLHVAAADFRCAPRLLPRLVPILCVSADYASHRCVGFARPGHHDFHVTCRCACVHALPPRCMATTNHVFEFGNLFWNLLNTSNFASEPIMPRTIVPSAARAPQCPARAKRDGVPVRSSRQFLNSALPLAAVSFPSGVSPVW